MGYVMELRGWLLLWRELCGCFLLWSCVGGYWYGESSVGGYCYGVVWVVTDIELCGWLLI